MYIYRYIYIERERERVWDSIYHIHDGCDIFYLHRDIFYLHDGLPGPPIVGIYISIFMDDRLYDEHDIDSIQQ